MWAGVPLKEDNLLRLRLLGHLLGKSPDELIPNRQRAADLSVDGVLAVTDSI
jgi:hypothetical protein